MNTYRVTFNNDMDYNTNQSMPGETSIIRADTYDVQVASRGEGYGGMTYLTFYRDGVSVASLFTLPKEVRLIDEA